MKTAITLLAGLLLSIFVITTGSGGKENNTTAELEPLHLDKLMPPNERVYLYFERYSPEYRIPMKYVLRCARLESSYKGIHDSTYAPYEDWLVSTADAYSVLQVRVIAAREVWPQYNYISKYVIMPYEFFSKRYFMEDSLQNKYRLKYGLDPTTVLEYKTDKQLAYLLRYNLRFNIETGIKYMRFLRDLGYSWVQVYSVYNQGWAGRFNINDYARFITKHG